LEVRILPGELSVKAVDYDGLFFKAR